MKHWAGEGRQKRSGQTCSWFSSPAPSPFHPPESSCLSVPSTDVVRMDQSKARVRKAEVGTRRGSRAPLPRRRRLPSQPSPGGGGDAPVARWGSTYPGEEGPQIVTSGSEKPIRGEPGRERERMNEKSGAGASRGQSSSGGRRQWALWPPAQMEPGAQSLALGIRAARSGRRTSQESSDGRPGLHVSGWGWRRRAGKHPRSSRIGRTAALRCPGLPGPPLTGISPAGKSSRIRRASLLGPRVVFPVQADF